MSEPEQNLPFAWVNADGSLTIRQVGGWPEVRWIDEHFAPPVDAKPLLPAYVANGGELATLMERLADHVGDHVEQYGREVGAWYWKLREIASATRAASSPAPSVAAPPREDETDRDAIARRAIAGELASMAFANSMGADSHMVRRLASAVLKALDAAS